MGIDDLRRREEGRQIVDPWLDRLNRALGITCSMEDFLSLDQTGAMKALFYQRLQDIATVQRRNWVLDDAEPLFRHLGELGFRWGSKKLVLFSSVDDRIGAIHVSGNVVLRNAPAIWEVVGEDFRVASVDVADGLCLGIEYYTLTGTYVSKGIYELNTWGAFLPGTAVA